MVQSGRSWASLGVSEAADERPALGGNTIRRARLLRPRKPYCSEVMMHWATLIAGAVWVISFYATRYVSLASILAAVALAISSCFLPGSSILVGVAVAIAGFVILRHRSNIVRLLNGTENKFVKKGAAPKS